MLGRKSAILASTALVASLALTACDLNDNPTPLTPQELGLFGLPVGEEIDIISATRGDGVSFDKFQVIFNNAEGTDITIITPEGEEINFTEADLEWAGSDPELGGIEVAKLTSSRGDRLDVTMGTIPVPRAADADDAEYEVYAEDQLDGEGVLIPGQAEGDLVLDSEGNPNCLDLCEGDLEDVPVAALARLDEVDTRDGFESYGVVGAETDPGNLARYEEDQLDGEGAVIPGKAAGDLVEGGAHYWGDFVASVSQRGENVSDSVSGGAHVDINFANNDVDIYLEGSYMHDDVDDLADAVTGVSSESDYAITSVTDNPTSVTASISHSHESVVGSGNTSIGTAVGSTSTLTATVVDWESHTHISVVGSVNEVEQGAFLGICPACIFIGTGAVDYPIGTTTASPVGEVYPTDVVESVSDNPVDVVNVDDPGVSIDTSVVKEVWGNPTNVVASTTTTDGLFLTSVSTTTENDNIDEYYVYLSGSGSSTDLDLGFDGSVQYSGMLDGFVQVEDGSGTTAADVAGTFAGAVYGPGTSAPGADGDSVSDVNTYTSTAGVFQADSGQALDDGELVSIEDTIGVDITGGFIASDD